APEVVAKAPLESHTSGNISLGIPNSSSNSSSQERVWILYKRYLDALVQSVMCFLPSERFHTNHESIVPRANCPASAFSRAPSTLSKIHLTLVATKYASMTKPVFSLTMGSWPWAISSSQ